MTSGVYVDKTSSALYRLVVTMKIFSKVVQITINQLIIYLFLILDHDNNDELDKLYSAVRRDGARK